MSDDEKDAAEGGDDGSGWNVKGGFPGFGNLNAGAALVDAAERFFSFGF